MEVTKDELQIEEQKADDAVSGLPRRRGFGKVSPAKTLSAKINRIWEIDFLRGLCLILMIVDHILLTALYVCYPKWSLSPNYDSSWLKGLCDLANHYFRVWGLRKWARPLVLKIFFVLAGISCGLTRSNIKRGLKLALFCVGLSLVMFIIELLRPGSMVYFGVLHMYAVAMLLFGFVDLGLKKLIIDKDAETSKDINLYISIFIFVAAGLLMILLGSYFENNPYPGTGVGAWFVYSWNLSHISSDYFPLFPSCGFIFLGAAFGRIAYKNKKSLLGEKLNAKMTKITKPINFTGKNTIWFYLGHQPVVVGLFYLFGLISGLGGLL